MHGKTFLALILAVALLAIPVHAVYPGDPGYRGCVMLTEDGQFDDTDCDKVPDIADNCALTHNVDQSDVDRNGIGDACDIVISELRIEPTTPMQGRSIVATVRIMNNRPYAVRDLDVKLEIPRLGLFSTDKGGGLDAGGIATREVGTGRPDCAPGTFTDVVAIVEHQYGVRQTEVFSQAVRVPVVQSGLCGEDTPGAGRTTVDIIEAQDVNAVEGALYPFTIKNNEAESKAYVLSIDGIERWGYGEIYPGGVIVIPAGEARDGALRIWSDPAWSGKQSFTFTVQSRDDAKQIVLVADITPSPQDIAPAAAPGTKLLLGLLAFLVVLLVLGGALYVLRHHHRDDVPSPRKKK